MIKHQTEIPPFSALGVILIAFVAMSLKAKSIIGSTASDVIRLSYVPVTVIRLPEKAPIRTHRITGNLNTTKSAGGCGTCGLEN